MEALFERKRDTAMIDNLNTPVLMIMYGKSVGGAELQFIELANYLANNHQVRLVSLGGDGALLSAQIDYRIEIRVYSYSGYLNTAKALIVAFFANIGYSTKNVVTTSFMGNFFGWAIGIFRKRRLVSLQTVSKCNRHPAVNCFVLRRFDALIAGAVDIKDYLISYGQDSSRIHVVHNWVDFSKRKPSLSVIDTRRKLGIGDQLIIGCIGRLHPQKGQIYLIRSFAKVLTEFPNTMLLLVGDGETKEELKKEVALLGLSRKIIFTGTVTGDEYNNLLAAIDVYVQPSVFEGIPRTLLDAMFMGKAIVATDVNGNREAIENEVTGLLVRSEDAEALSQAQMRLLRDHGERDRLSKQAIKFACNNFSMIKKITEIERLLVDQP
ncbi:MAG: glycosyltransferase family 4 protein [Deltaproteobacteria bacterium]